MKGFSDACKVLYDKYHRLVFTLTFGCLGSNWGISSLNFNSAAGIKIFCLQFVFRGRIPDMLLVTLWGGGRAQQRDTSFHCAWQLAEWAWQRFADSFPLFG